MSDVPLSRDQSRLIFPGLTSNTVLTDFLWLAALALLLIATGIGLRDPWPADEPRFALVARDMVATGQWLLPRVGGQPYADKPPLFFWLIAVCLEATRSLRVAFLLPSFFAGLGCVGLVYDLGRRLWNRETGLAAGLALLFTVQFVWQARQAQIDAALCFWTTLSLYGLLRHLLLGPAWRWYTIGWAAAGLGVITKGVGFLPLLVLVPFAILRNPKWKPRMSSGGGMRWLIGPLAFLAAVSIWLVPMLIAAHGDPTIAAYRDEILFNQTIHRYGNAWHHREPFWYFIVNVIPVLWLPLTLLVPWLFGYWRTALRSFDLRIALLASWIVLVVLFFTLSSGKRGVYVLPAVPAFALLCSPYLKQIGTRRGVQRAMFVLASVIGALSVLAWIYLAIRPEKRVDVIASYDLDPLGPLALIAIAAMVVCAIARPWRGFFAYAGVLAASLLIVSFWINPELNDARSGADFVARVERAADPRQELGLVAFKEQYVLNARREIVHFGHARWREAEQEMADAALWLSGKPGRQLVINDDAREACFREAPAQSLGAANRSEWFLVKGGADPACVARGKPGVAHYYLPPVVPGTRLKS
ncbi:MAG TPA: glycosyltransferase family 39 protein [Steroidobacteraceae bacterium]|jgi:4-amino-4-deoxy-L-arabinose transferase-like glycosyltransferase|nr:glycosyltransferase family 39 protein [Steroidobacteraceae bacterium]